MARPRGSKNKTDQDSRDFVAQVFRERNPHKLVIEMLDNPEERSRVFLRLLEYLYGKPKESLEVSGKIDLRSELAEARKRAGID